MQTTEAVLSIRFVLIHLAPSTVGNVFQVMLVINDKAAQIVLEYAPTEQCAMRTQNV